MAGPTASCDELTQRYQFELATPADNQGLRSLLRTTPIRGEISITIEHEPDFFAASELMGSLHQTLIARNMDTNNIIASGSRSVRKMYLGGSTLDIGYLSELRIDHSYQGNFSFIRKGYEALNRLHGDEAAPYYLTSIVSDNVRARRILEKGIKGMPTYIPIGTFLTLVIPTRHSSLKSPSDCATATQYSRKQIVDCIHRNYKRFAWSPYWKPEELGSETRTPGLAMEDFLVSHHGDDMNGCMALWNQQRFRQIVVRGYSPRLSRWRPFINVLSRISGSIRLPATGTPWSYAFVSPLAVDNDDPEVFTRLLQSTIHRAKASGYDYVLLGLAENHPLLGITRRSVRLRREYSSQLYLVTWNGRPSNMDVIQHSVPHPEIALL